MRNAAWIGVFAALISAGAWAQSTITLVNSATYKPALAFGTVPVQACPAKFDFHPEIDGIYKSGGDIRAPKLKHYVPAQLSTEAKTRGAFNPFKPDPSTISFVVDADGVPQDLCIMKPARYGLDEEAAKAVWQYRFEPGKGKDGTPVAVRVSIEVKFN